MYTTRETARLATLIVAMTAANGAHSADSGAYATAQFGLARQSDQTLAFSGSGPAQRGNAILDGGGLAGGALGWDFGNGWRLEGEFVYQSVDSKIVGFAAPALVGSGNYASTSVAVNALYAFDLFGSPRALTYVGAGLVRLTEVDIDIETGSGELSYSGTGNAVQLMAGARYALGERWYIDAGLRWLSASSVDLDGEGATIGRLAADYEPWAVTVGIGWRF
jgi:opacity protein-like surface antigen